MTKFTDAFDDLVAAAQERFERDGSHDHMVYLLASSDTGLSAQEVPFDAILSVMPGPVDFRKEMAYRTIADMMVKRATPGYVEIHEIWVLSMGKGDDALNRYQETIRRYGSLKNAPGRIEMLAALGRYGDETRNHNWKIGRRGTEAWLEKGDKWTNVNDQKACPSKASMLDQAALTISRAAGALAQGTRRTRHW